MRHAPQERRLGNAKIGGRTAGEMQIQLFWLPGSTGLVIKNPDQKTDRGF
jgi:hypothetical protein